MELTELLPTAWAEAPLPLTRSAEPEAVPVCVMPKLTLEAVAVMTPVLACWLDSALEGTPAPKVTMLRLFAATLPKAAAEVVLFASEAFELTTAAPVSELSASE